MLYRVTWEIDVDADTANDAAAKAREIVASPDTTATVYTVTDVYGNSTEVDLLEADEY